MSKKPRKPRNKATIKASSEPSRRDVLKLARNGAVGAVALGGVGYFGMGSFRAHAAEHDLTRIGQGDPVVVQVHDPSCPMCTALQKQTRAALKSCNEGSLIYLVADINTDEGRAFAVRQGVGHVTLLLMDGKGAVQRTVQGVHSSAQLEPMFAEHKARAQV